MKFLLLITVSFFFVTLGIAQQAVYSIEGKISNVDTGKIFLVPAIGDAKYYGKNYEKDSAVIQNGYFKIRKKNNDNHTYAYRLLIQSPIVYGATDFVFISNKDVFIAIDSLDEHIAPNINSSSVQKEMKEEYNSFFKAFIDSTTLFYDYAEQVSNKYNNLLPKNIRETLETMQHGLQQQSDSLFALYAANHPKSEVTFWKMIERLKNVGYRNEYESIYTMLPFELQHSLAGQSLHSEIKESEVLNIGHVFPPLQLENTHEALEFIHQKLWENQYTLIDFWFAACAPCRKQFPEFKRLFKKFGRVGFQIIGISVDSESTIPAWKKLIEKDQLQWHQLLDKNGLATQKLGIHSFPTNFLLDSKGVILQKNISIADLEILLLDAELKNIHDKIKSIEPE